MKMTTSKQNIVRYGEGMHLVLAKTQTAIEDAMYDIRSHFRDTNIHAFSAWGNGMHYEEIQKYLDEYRTKNLLCFIGTMNPSVIDRMNFTSAEDAQKRILLGGPFRNMTDDQAEKFWSGYGTGYQHVSEILRMEGIW